MISFVSAVVLIIISWESVTNPLDKLCHGARVDASNVGNQLPILLISFYFEWSADPESWESVTNPLDKLSFDAVDVFPELGISYQSS